MTYASIPRTDLRSLSWEDPTGRINICGMAGDLAIQRQYQGFPASFTGPTGPVGGQGNTGPAGPGFGYATAVGVAADAILPNAPIIFELGGLIYPHLGITPPSAGVGGTTFTINTTGIYEYNFYVAATSGVDLIFSVQVSIWVNGVQASTPNPQGYRYQSSLGSTTGNVNVCTGEGLIHLSAGDAVTLNNITNSGTLSISFLNPGTLGSGVSQAGATRVLTLKQVG